MVTVLRTDHRYYRLANLNENQCAKYVVPEPSTALTTYESTGTSSFTSSRESTRSPSITKQGVATESDIGLTTAYKSPGTTSSRAPSSRPSLATQQKTESDKLITYVATESDAESSIRSSSVTQQEKENNEQIIYVAGSLGALVLAFGALIIVLSILYLCKVRNRETCKSQLTNTCMY